MKLMHLFKGSLKNIINMHMHENLTRAVKNDWIQLWNSTRHLVKVSEETVSNAIIVTMRGDCFTEILKAMRQSFNLIKADFDIIEASQLTNFTNQSTGFYYVLAFY